jgi:transcriptional antiterminator NusG
MAMHWYIIHTYSGYEEKVKINIEQRIKPLGLEGKIGEIIIPTGNVVELKKGQRHISSKKFFPGYLLVQMELTNESWHAIKSTPKVNGFIGVGKTPSPIPESEVDRILNQIKDGEAKPTPKVLFEEGEMVKIIDGPFSGFNGVVGHVNPVRGKVKVMVSIFGRSTPVELDFLQVGKQ